MGSAVNPGYRSEPLPRGGFTLLELLVVIAVTGVLMGILFPALSRSRQAAVQTVCLSGMQQLGVALSSYALENEGFLPYGPKSLPPSADNFYPQTGNVTSLISLKSGAPVGLGLLLSNQLASRKEVLFCPGADDDWDVQDSLARVGVKQVEASYYYRHASVVSLSGTLPPPRMELDRLGKNRNGAPIRCLALDTQFLSTPTMEEHFDLKTRTHHRQKVVNALYLDGHASSHQNARGRFTVNVSISAYQTLSRILENFESLDKE